MLIIIGARRDGGWLLIPLRKNAKNINRLNGIGFVMNLNEVAVETVA